MPARYRDDLQSLCAGRLTVTKHPHGCLMVFPRPYWENFRDQVAQLPFSQVGVKRVFLGHAEGQVDCLDVVAVIEVAEGRPADGLRLFEVVGATRRRLGLELSTPDERRDREAAIAVARASLDEATIVAIETAASQTDIGTAAMAVLDAAPAQ